MPNPREHQICMCNLYRLRPGLIPVARCLRRVDHTVPRRNFPERKPSNASVVMRSSEWSMESRMHRSRNATMTCLWLAQCLVGGKGKRYAERHQEGRIHFIHHGTPTHSQHQRILGRGFRARQGIINEWLRRNLNGCRFARECAVPCKQGAAQTERLFPFWHKADIPQRPARVRSSCQGGHRNRNRYARNPIGLVHVTR